MASTHENHQLHIPLPDGRLVTLTPDQALAFVAWLQNVSDDLPLALVAWLSEHESPPDVPPLEPYVLAQQIGDDYYIVDFGRDLPDEPFPGLATKSQKPWSNQQCLIALRFFCSRPHPSLCERETGVSPVWCSRRRRRRRRRRTDGTLVLSSIFRNGLSSSERSTLQIVDLSEEDRRFEMIIDLSAEGRLFMRAGMVDSSAKGRPFADALSAAFRGSFAQLPMLSSLSIKRTMTLRVGEGNENGSRT